MAGDAKPKRASRAADLRAWRAKQRCGGLLPFQQAFSEAVSRVKRPPDIAALSCPRGNGKSWLCGRLVARSLTPGDSLFDEGVENVLVSASRPQAAIVLEFAREALGEAQGYRWRKDGVEHLDSRTRVRVIGRTRSGHWDLARISESSLQTSRAHGLPRLGSDFGTPSRRRWASGR